MSSLSNILATLIRIARDRQPKRYAGRELQGGLYLAAVWDSDVDLRILMWRYGVDPGWVESNTIHKHLPNALKQVQLVANQTSRQSAGSAEKRPTANKQIAHTREIILKVGQPELF